MILDFCEWKGLLEKLVFVLHNGVSAVRDVSQNLCQGRRYLWSRIKQRIPSSVSYLDVQSGSQKPTWRTNRPRRAKIRSVAKC